MNTPAKSEGKPTQSVRQPNRRSGSTLPHSNHVRMSPAPGGNSRTKSDRLPSWWWQQGKRKEPMAVRLTQLRDSECWVRVEYRGESVVVPGCMQMVEMLQMLRGNRGAQD